jgi:thymidylate kinase
MTTISLAAFSKDAGPDAIATFLLKINPFQGLSRLRDEHEQMNFKNEEYEKSDRRNEF